MVAAFRPRIGLRSMCPGDVAMIGAMEAASYDFPWSRGIFADCLRAAYACRVLTVDDVAAGYGIVAVAAGEAHVLNLCIAAAWRSQGLGRYLLLRLLDIARRGQAGRAFLEVRVSNAQAIALYASAGFHEIGRRPRYYPAREGREDAIVMAIDLPGDSI